MHSIDNWWVGILTYLPFHCLHIFVWRLIPPRRDVLELVLYLLILPLALGLLWVGLGGSLSWPQALLHLLLAVNYIAIYPAFQASSPTVRLICLLLDHPLGLTPEKTEETMRQITGVDHRIQDLSKSRLLFKGPRGEWKLSFYARIIARFFLIYRRSLGLEQGAG